jgi:ubiquinol-cytochrome c reductase cytochrome b subunit
MASAYAGVRERVRGLAAGPRVRGLVIGPRGRGDRWAVLFGEIAVYAFGVLVVTGVFLTFFYRPDMAQVRYDGSYGQLRGVTVSKAYESTLHVSFDVRGGMLVRQIHHWATLIFTAAVCCRLLRMFVTGAFRRPRVKVWLVWVAMFTLAMAAGVTGSLLPDDMLSGGSLGLIQGITLSIPVVGTRLSGLVFGPEFPGQLIIPRAYWAHVVVLPVAMIGLGMLGRRLARKAGHGALPPRRHGEVREVPVVPRAAVLLFTCGVLALLGTVAQINPVWMYGPYEPGAITSGAVPDWYMGFLDGAIRIMPGWEISIGGHPLTLAVLVPALIVPGGFFTLLAGYPWLERRFTGDDGLHRLLDRPRDAATRTGICAAGLTWYGLLWMAAANDQIAVGFHLSLFAVTWFFRIAVFVGPMVAFAVTRAVCLALVEREHEEAVHGRETGRIVMSAEGGFHEIHSRPGELVRGPR